MMPNRLTRPKKYFIVTICHPKNRTRATGICLNFVIILSWLEDRITTSAMPNLKVTSMLVRPWACRELKLISSSQAKWRFNFLALDNIYIINLLTHRWSRWDVFQRVEFSPERSTLRVAIFRRRLRMKCESKNLHCLWVQRAATTTEKPQWHDFLPVYQNSNHEKIFNNRCHTHDDWCRC